MKKRAKHRHKRVWRQADVKDFEDYLDEERLEERLGGPLSQQVNETLFQIDVGSSRKKTSVKQKRTSVVEQKNLKCFSQLNSLTKTKPLLKHRVKPPEQHESKLVTSVKNKPKFAGKMLKRLQNQRIASKIEKKAMKQRAEPKKFTYDLWGSEIKPDRGEKYPLNKPGVDTSWFDHATVAHIHSVDKVKPVAAPRSYRKKPNLLPAVELPHPGLSYNPSYSDHQSLLLEAHKDLQLKLSSEKRRERQLDAKFPSQAEMPTEDSKLVEMSEGLDNNFVDVFWKSQENAKQKRKKVFPVIAENTEGKGSTNTENVKDPYPSKVPKSKNRKKVSKNSDKNDESFVEEEEIPEQNSAPNRTDRKTEKTRKKQKAHKMLMLKQQMEKQRKKQEKQISMLKTINCELDDADALTAKRIENRLRKIEMLKYKTRRVGRNKMVETPLVLSLPENLDGRLRTMKTEGSLILDRFTSAEKRNILEPTKKRLKKKLKVKQYYRSSYMSRYERAERRMAMLKRKDETKKKSYIKIK